MAAPWVRPVRSRSIAGLLATAMLTSLLVVLPAPPARAAVTFTVDSTDDSSDLTPGDGACRDDAGQCTIRAAIEEANATAGAVVVQLPLDADGVGGATYQLATMTQITVTGDVTILGPGTTTPGTGEGPVITILEAVHRLFEVSATGRLQLQYLELQGGNADVGDGGCVLNHGTFSASHINASWCSAVNGGFLANATGATASVSSSSVSNNSATTGGAVHNAGTLTLASVDVVGNTATDGAGLAVVSGSASVSSSHLRSNTAADQGGGAYLAPGAALTVGPGSFLRQNHANTEGGGMFSHGTATLDGVTVHENTAPSGAGISLGGGQGRVDLLGVDITSNTATASGGGITALGGSTLVVTGGQIIGNSAGGSGGGAYFPGTNTAEFTKTVIAANHAEADGGGIYINTGVAGVIDVIGSVIRDNTAGNDGGGIAAETGGVDIADSLLTANHAARPTAVGAVAAGSGGAVFNRGVLNVADSTLSANSGDTGGAISSSIHPTHPLAATVRIERSTLQANQASLYGGAVYADGSLDLLDSTVAANSANSEGGGLWADADLGIHNSTISGNTAGFGGGIFRAGPNTVNEYFASLSFTTVTGNIASSYAGVHTDAGVVSNTVLEASAIVGNVDPAGTPSNCHGPHTSSWSVLGVACPIATDLGGTQYDVASTQFAPLADNGGRTQTHLPLAGGAIVDSVAIDALPCRETGLLDQRGEPRPSGAGCDAGAVEVQVAPPSLAVQLLVDKAQVAPGASVVPTEQLDGAALVNHESDSSGTTASTPLNSVPLNSVPLNSVPLNSVPLNSVPLNSVSLDDPLIAPVLDAILSSELTLTQPYTYGGVTYASIDDLVQTSPALAGRPAQSVTLGAMVDDATIGPAVRSVPLNSVDLGATPLNSVPLWTVMVNGTTESESMKLTDLPWSAVVANGQVSDSEQTHIQALCSWLLTLQYSCTELGLGLGPTYDVTAAANVSMLEASIASAPLNSVPLNSVPLNSVPLNSVPLNSVPLNSVPLNSVPLNSVTVDLNPDPAVQNLTTLDQVTLASAEVFSVPLNSVPLNSVPLNSVDPAASPLNSVPLNSVDLTASPLNSVPLNSVPLNSVAFQSIPLNSVPLNSVPLNSVPLNSVDLLASPLNSVPLNSVPADVRDQLLTCGSNCVSTTLGEARTNNELRSEATVGLLTGWIPQGYSFADLVAFVNAPDALTATTLGHLNGLFGTDITLRHLQPDITVGIGEIVTWLRGLGGTAAAAAEDLLQTTVIGQLLGLGDLTFADLLVLLGETLLREVLEFLVFFPDSENISLLDLLLILIPPSEFPWNEADLSGGGIQAAAAGTGGQLTYSVDFAIETGANRSDVTVLFDVPTGGYVAADLPATLYVPGSATPASVLPTSTGLQAKFVLSDLDDGNYTLAIPVGAPLEIGAKTAGVTVSSSEDALTAMASAEIAVTEEFEPNDTFADLAGGGGQPLADDMLYLSHLHDVADVDLYPTTLAAGEGYSAFLGNVPDGADFDLVLYGPPGTELPGVGVDSVDTGDGVPQIADDVLLLPDSCEGGAPAATCRPVLRVSADRGDNSERVDLPPVPFAGEYVVQVTSYNGQVASAPYTLQQKTFPAPSLPPCEPWPAGLTTTTAGAPAVTLPALTSETRTLFLVHRDRYAGAFGAAAVQSLDTLLATVANLNGVNGDPTVKGAVVDLSALPSTSAVTQAYAAWDGTGRCSVGAANVVADAIRALVNDARAIAPIGHVVVVGTDEQIPFHRVQDFVELSNERTFAGALRRFDANGAPVADELLAAAAFGYYLTDNGYGDSTTEVAGNRPIWTPEIGVGRLVETAGEIEGQLQRFVDFKGRLATSTKSFVTGYDFLTDGANAVADNLPGTPDRLISETWTSGDLRDRVAIGGDDILSMNAHYDHRVLLSAAEDTAGTQADLFSATEVTGDYAGTIAFTMGCHSGLSISDVSVGLTVTDWAQRWGQLQGLYVGNTGYGYGDTEIVALSETLMSQFAERLDGRMTVGQALSFAKSEYAADLSVYGVYDEKVLMQATFYGLPMYAIGEDATQPPVADVVPLDVDHGLLARRDVDFGASQTFAPVATGDGGYYVVEQNGERFAPQATFDQPIQPRWELDVTADDGFGGTSAVARSAVIESLQTSSAALDPQLALPVVDRGSEAIEPLLDDLTFPSTFTRISREDTPTGPRDQLVFVPGQFDGTSRGGTQTLFDQADLTVYYAPLDSTDQERPRVLSSRAAAVGTNVGFTVEARDNVGIQRVAVLYLEPGSTSWRAVNLAHVSTAIDGTQAWSGGAVLTQAPPAGSSVAYYVQVIDTSANGGFSSDKALFHDAPAVAPPGDGGTPDGTGSPAVAGTLNGGWYSSDVTVTVVDDPDGDATLTVNGAPVSSPATIGTSGTYEIVVRDEGQTSTTFVLIDKDAPQLTIDRPLQGAMVARDSIVPLRFTAVDAGAGLDPATLSDTEPAAVPTGTLGNRSQTVTVSDVLGHTATARVDYTVVTLQGTTAPIAIGSTFTLDVIGLTDPAGLEVDWGEGLGFAPPLSVEVLSDRTRLTHTYTTEGLHRVNVRRNGPAIEYRYAVVYDPAGGMVVGGGRFDSPVGALSTNANLGGSATFGFNAKYKEGWSVPEGETNFQFVEGDLHFVSTAYQWLIVQGGRAQYLGEGVINPPNGNPAKASQKYRFTLVGIDGDLGDVLLPDQDTIRIKIWKVNGDGSDGAVVYDNGLGAPIDTNAGTPITRGQIKVKSG